MKIFITGATGFVGSHLCHLLTAAGHEVFSLCRNPKKFEQFQVCGHMISGGLNSEGKDVWLDQLPDDLDAVVHTAGVLHTFEREQFEKVNHLATLNLVNNLRTKYAKLRFIQISSLAAAGPSLKEQHLRSETETADTPVSQYGRTKLAAEKSLLKNAPEDWSVAIVRPPMVIGPHDPAMADLFKMVKGRIVLVPGLKGLESSFSFVCVYDLVDFIQKVLEQTNDLGRQTYYCAHPQIVTLRDIIASIQKQLKRQKVLFIPVPHFGLKSLAHLGLWLHKYAPIELRLTPDKYHEIIQPHWLCSNQKSIEQLGMEYQWDLKKTVEATTEDYLKRNWL